MIPFWFWSSLLLFAWLWTGFLFGCLGLQYQIPARIFVKVMLVSVAGLFSTRLRDWATR